MAGEATRAERLWTMTAGACLIIAATALLWGWHVELAFVAATLGVVCWFLNMRGRLKKSIVHEVEETEDFGEDDENQ